MLLRLLLTNAPGEDTFRVLAQALATFLPVLGLDWLPADPAGIPKPTKRVQARLDLLRQERAARARLRTAVLRHRPASRARPRTVPRPSSASIGPPSPATTSGTTSSTSPPRASRPSSPTATSRASTAAPS